MIRKRINIFISEPCQTCQGFFAIHEYQQKDSSSTVGKWILSAWEAQLKNRAFTLNLKKKVLGFVRDINLIGSKRWDRIKNDL